MRQKRVLIFIVSLMLMIALVGCSDRNAYNDLFTVVFYSGTDSAVIETTYVESVFNVESGSLVVQPEDPTSDGATFLGWYKEKEGINPWDFDTDTITASTVIYAHWKIADFDIEYSFDDAGGTFIDDPIYSYNVLVNEILPGVTREGSRFIGWILTTVDEYIVGDPVIESTTGYVGDLHLYALFENKDFVVRFRSNSTEVSNPVIHTVQFVDKMNFPGLPDTSTQKFVGWFSLDGTETGEWGFQYVNGEPFLGKATWNEVDQEFTFRAQDVVLYAQWEDK